MPRDTREVLLLLANKGATRKRLERISEGYRVVSAFPPNLVVAEVAEPELQEMRRDPAVQFVVEGVVPDELLDELTDDEKLFVRGWLLKRTSPAKQRPGAGLAWDAPGFLPPDPPPGLK